MKHQGTQVLFVPRWIKDKVDKEQKLVSCLDSTDDLLRILKPDDLAFYFAIQPLIEEHPCIKALINYQLECPLVVQPKSFGVLKTNTTAPIPDSIKVKYKQHVDELSIKKAQLGDMLFMDWLMHQCISGKQTTPIIGYDVFQIGACTIGVSPKYLNEDLPIYMVENNLYEAFLDAIAPWTPIEAMATYDAFKRYTQRLTQ